MRYKSCDRINALIESISAFCLEHGTFITRNDLTSWVRALFGVTEGYSHAANKAVSVAQERTGIGFLGTDAAANAADALADVIDSIIDGSAISVRSTEATSIRKYAFYNYPTIKNVDFPEATSIGANAFNGCGALTSINFPLVSSIESGAFRYCSGLTSVSFPRVETIGSSAFYPCSGLTSVSFPLATSIGDLAFESCRKLTSISFPKAESIGGEAFAVCDKLASADFPLLTSIDNSAFAFNSKFKTLILRLDGICSLSSTSAFTVTPIESGTGYIYVPRSLVDSYKTATNWTVYASQFRALEDYTVDGTTTGALDESKI